MNRIIFVALVATSGVSADAASCAPFRDALFAVSWPKVRACDSLKVKGRLKVVLFQETRRGQVDLLVFPMSARGGNPRPELQIKGLGQALVPLRTVSESVVEKKQNMIFRDVTGDKVPELIFRVKNGRHADLYVLDLRRLDAHPELQFLEVSQLQNPEGGNTRNYLIHDASQDVLVLEDGSIGASASDPFLGVDKRFMAFASYRNGRMGVEYIERVTFDRRLRGVDSKIARKHVKKSKKTAGRSSKSNKRI